MKNIDKKLDFCIKVAKQQSGTKYVEEESDNEEGREEEEEKEEKEEEEEES